MATGIWSVHARLWRITPKRRSNRIGSALNSRPGLEPGVFDFEALEWKFPDKTLQPIRMRYVLSV
jgi:hypothetical protein